MKENIETAAPVNAEEASSGQISIKKKKNRLTILLLIVSIVAAVALWVYVVVENNTVNAVQINVSGNERLMGENLSISSVEPKNLSLVLRGKSDLIKQVVSDRSLIEAKVNVFKNPQSSSDPGDYIFESESDAKVGVFTVAVEITLPDGVTCAKKEVTVTITETAAKRVETKGIGHTITNYSFSPGCSLNEIYFEQQWLTIIGDVQTIAKISSVAVVSDWSKEISGDIEINGLVPVAYDDEGDVIDSRFLRFDPAVLQLNVTVNKRRTIRLALQTDEDDLFDYQLSMKEVTVFGPIALIDKLDDVYCINKKDLDAGKTSIENSYEVRASDVAASVSGSALLSDQLRFMDLGGNEMSFVKVAVVKNETKRSTQITVPAAQIRVFTAEGYGYEIPEDYGFKVYYVPKDGKTPSPDDFTCFIDMTGYKDGEYRTAPVVGLLNLGDFIDVSYDELPAISVRIVKNGEPTPVTPTGSNTPDEPATETPAPQTPAE